MRRILTWAGPVAGAVTLVAMAMTAPVGAESPDTLTVRLYNTSGIPVERLLAARTAADSILRETGLDVKFRHCGHLVQSEEPIDPCDEPLKPSEVVVRLIDAPPFNAALNADTYGVAYVVKKTNRGWLATVFPDRIGKAAERVDVEPGTLLGRVIAHEVGHLLLGVDYHGANGLMRAEWPDALLTRTEKEWRFSTIEAARMLRVLASIPRRPPAHAAVL